MSAKVHQLYADRHPNDRPILIPDAQYTVSYVEHRTWLYMGRYPKLVITFLIQDPGEFYLMPISGYYNVKLKGKPRKGGQFSAGWRSDFMIDYSTCFETPLRKDRINMCRFRNVLLIVSTKTVTHNRVQREYPVGMRYSVVNSLDGVFL